MSVRKDQRTLSKMEYINNAQSIVYLVSDRINKYINKVATERRYKHFFKSSTYSIWNSPIYHSQQVYQYVQLANKERDTIKRLDYLSNASRNLDLLESSTQTVYQSFKRVIKDKFIELLTDKIDFERKLLKGQARIISCQQPLQL